MKRILLIMTLLLAGFAAWAGEPYCCTTPGRTLVYERTKANGRIERTVTMEYTAVRRSGTKRLVDCILTVRGPGGAELYGGPSEQTTTVNADGTVVQNLGESLRAVLHNMFPGAAQSVEDIPAILPADMKPGDRLPDAHSSVSAGALTYTVDITEREVLRAERVTVPAGTFDCLVVREHKVEKGPGRNRNTVSDSWYAPGVGYVRHDTYDKNMRLDTTEVLKKY